ncbi:MAG: hypothetical protein H0X29_05515 [Parachlamydiaceae bacterium]|nr:hypothetical protein [Parachlamydiaceae bacterium]
MIYSISSKLVTTITTIRNPQGNEGNWLKSDQKFYQLPSGKARLAAEIGYALTTVVALIETLVSGSCLILSVPLALASSKPLQKTTQWLESSAFTLIWSAAYLHFNLKAPNLLTREDLSRNFALRGDIEKSNSYPKAPFLSRFFMIPREMPAYFSTAYALRFKDFQIEKGVFSRLFGKIKRYKQLIGEVLRMDSSQSALKHNIDRLDSDFAKINDKLVNTKRPLCAYFVSDQDYNGAILGDPVYYYHHYKIGKFEKHFDVSAKVVRTTEEMFKHLNELKLTYPDRPIKVVDIVAHGNHESIDINLPFQQEQGLSPNQDLSYNKEHVGKNEFNACAPDADIILDACSTGAGDNNIAKLIAEQNPGKRVYAPGTSLFFSKPVFKTHNGMTKIDHVTHGFAIVNAYTSREFQV